MGAIPSDFDDVTPGWLNEHCGLGGTVGDVTIERIGEGFGMISLIGRASLDYSQGAGPETIVVKLPSRVPELVDMAQMYGLYEREVNFYNHASSQLPNVAKSYHAAVDATGRSCSIVVEDLGHMRMADQVVGCTVDDARAAMYAAADLHSRFWSNDALASLTWLPPVDNPMYRGSEEVYRQVFPDFVEKYGDTVSPASMKVAEDLRTRAITLMELGATEPEQSLAHYDLRLDNLMFAEDVVYLLDWQLSVRCVPAHDVAYFLGWSMQNDLRREFSEKLIAHYHAKLIDHGITGFSLDRCTDLVRRSMLLVAVIAAYGSVAVPATNERGQKLLDAMVERVFSAVDDMNCAELMPA